MWGSTAERRRKIVEFIDVTKLDPDSATVYLENTDWDVQARKSLVFRSNGPVVVKNPMMIVTVGGTKNLARFGNYNVAVDIDNQHFETTLRKDTAAPVFNQQFASTNFSSAMFVRFTLQLEKLLKLSKAYGHVSLRNLEKADPLPLEFPGCSRRRWSGWVCLDRYNATDGFLFVEIDVLIPTGTDPAEEYHRALGGGRSDARAPTQTEIAAGENKEARREARRREKDAASAPAKPVDFLNLDEDVPAIPAAAMAAGAPSVPVPAGSAAPSVPVPAGPGSRAVPTDEDILFTLFSAPVPPRNAGVLPIFQGPPSAEPFMPRVSDASPQGSSAAISATPNAQASLNGSAAWAAGADPFAALVQDLSNNPKLGLRQQTPPDTQSQVAMEQTRQTVLQPTSRNQSSEGLYEGPQWDQGLTSNGDFPHKFSGEPRGDDSPRQA